MSDGRVGRWRDLLREVVAVLGAILIAFALDAWWDARVERTDMLRALEAVSVELGENIVAADSILAWNQHVFEMTSRLIQLTPEDLASLPNDERAEFGVFTQGELMNPRLGALTAFIDGGFLAAVDDVELRTAVAGIPSILDELSEEAVAHLDLGVDVIRRISGALGPSGVGEGLAGDDFTTFVPEIVAAVVVDPDARKAIASQNLILAVYQGELSTLIEELSATRGLIDAALAAR